MRAALARSFQPQRRPTSTSHKAKLAGLTGSAVVSSDVVRSTAQSTESARLTTTAHLNAEVLLRSTRLPGKSTSTFECRGAMMLFAIHSGVFLSGLVQSDRPDAKVLSACEQSWMWPQALQILFSWQQLQTEFGKTSKCMQLVQPY